MDIIPKINKVLKEKNSNFRTSDGFTISMYIGHLTFI